MIEIAVLASSSNGNCYRVTDGSTPLLIEAGLPWREIRRRLGFRTHEIAGCLISHEHQDHARAAKDLLREGLPCYMSAGTAEALGLKPKIDLLQFLFPNLQFCYTQFSLGTWAILPFPIQHDAAEPQGFLLASGGEKLVYITDSCYSRWRFQGLTHIMIECNYAEDILRDNVAAGKVHPIVAQRLRRSHFSLERVKDFLRANDLSRVREIHLLHLSDTNADAERFKREVQELTGRPVYVAAR